MVLPLPRMHVVYTRGPKISVQGYSVFRNVINAVFSSGDKANPNSWPLTARVFSDWRSRCPVATRPSGRDRWRTVRRLPHRTGLGAYRGIVAEAEARSQI